MTTMKCIADKNGGTQVAMGTDEQTAFLAVQAAQAASQPRLTLLAQISALEATQTPRRIRNAMAGTDNGWLAALETQIAALRAQLT